MVRFGLERYYNTMKKITILTGHYGAGKTNMCVNMALELADKGSMLWDSILICYLTIAIV